VDLFGAPRASIDTWLVTPWLSLLFLLLTGYAFAFFRDPDRAAPADPEAVLAAADGVVVEITDADEPEVINARMRRVAIFLSISMCTQIAHRDKVLHGVSR